MTSASQARALALGLPEVTEQERHGRVSFLVAGKIFATVWDDAQWNVLLDEAGIRSAVTRMPEGCAEVWGGQALRAVRVQLSKVPAAALRTLLTDAWEQKAAKPPSNEPPRKQSPRE